MWDDAWAGCVLKSGYCRRLIISPLIAPITASRGCPAPTGILFKPCTKCMFLKCAVYGQPFTGAQSSKEKLN